LTLTSWLRWLLSLQREEVEAEEAEKETEEEAGSPCFSLQFL
jgi:hypothetical protein